MGNNINIQTQRYNNKRLNNNKQYTIQQNHHHNLNYNLPQTINIKCKVRFPGLFVQFWKQGSIKLQTQKNSILVGKTGKVIRLNLTIKQNVNNSKGKLILESQIQLNRIDDRTIAFIQDKKQVKIYAKFKEFQECQEFVDIYKKVYLRLIKQYEKILIQKRSSKNKNIIEYGLHLSKSDDSKIDHNVNSISLLGFKKAISSEQNHRKNQQLNKQQKSSYEYQKQSQQQEIIQSAFEKDQNFEICKYQKNCIIKMHKNKAQLRVQLLIGLNDSMEQILSVILNQKGWNTQIKSQQIINKLDTNVFMVKRVYKPYSRLSYQRETVSLVQFQKLNSKRGLLMEETIQNQDYYENLQIDKKNQKNQKKIKKQKTVKAQIKTIIFFEKIQTFNHNLMKSSIKAQKNIRLNIKQEASNSVHPLSINKTKIIIETSFKGNGYCSQADNRAMLLQMFQSIIYFQDHYLIAKMKNSPQRKTFVNIKNKKKDQSLTLTNEKRVQSSYLEKSKQIRQADSINNHLQQQQQQQQQKEKEKEDFVEQNFNINPIIKKNNKNSFSIITQKTDFTQLTTKQLQLKKFIQLRPLKGLQKVDEEYLELIQKQLYETSYIFIMSNNFDGNIQKNNNKTQQAKISQFQKKKHMKLQQQQQLNKQKINQIGRQQKNKNQQKRFNIFNNKQTWDETRPWYCLQGLLQKGGQYQITPQKQLVMINYNLIQSQKSTLTFVIKQIGVNLISGKSVLNVSLPVDIFQSQSLLQRSAASFGYAPHYLQEICQKQPFQQMKNIFAFIASIPTLELNMMKPFNPILGQTFQAYIKGIPIFYQQISHHPPVSSYFMQCQQFKLYGNLIAYADVGLNSAVGGNSGAMHIQLKNGSHFQCYFPPCQISGLIYGKRKFRAYGKGFIYERKSHLFCEFSIEKQKKGIYQFQHKKIKEADLVGGIYSINQKLQKQFLQYSTCKTNIRKFQGISKNHIKQKLAKINGIWFDTLYVNGQAIKKGRSYPLEYHSLVLPSDCNYRTDIMYHRSGNQSKSQFEKQVLQNLQRSDRKLRQRHAKKK